MLTLSMLFDLSPAGLDSFAALSVMGHMRKLAQTSQQTVIATIHQPRTAIWQMFDTVSCWACWAGRWLQNTAQHDSTRHHGPALTHMFARVALPATPFNCACRSACCRQDA